MDTKEISTEKLAKGTGDLITKVVTLALLVLPISLGMYFGNWLWTNYPIKKKE